MQDFNLDTAARKRWKKALESRMRRGDKAKLAKALAKHAKRNNQSKKVDTWKTLVTQFVKGESKGLKAVLHTEHTHKGKTIAVRRSSKPFCLVFNPDFIVAIVCSPQAPAISC